HPARHGRHRAQHAGPGEGVYELRNPRRRVERPRTTRRRSRLADRVLPVVRVRPRRLRGALRGEARLAHTLTPEPTCDLVRQVSIGAHEPIRDPGPPGRTSPHLGWSRWKPAVGGSGRPLRPALDAGRDRRTSGPLRTVGRALQARARGVWAPAAADWNALTWIRCANGPGGRRHPVAVLEGDLRESGARAGMGAPDHGQVPGRTGRRIAVYRIARNRRHQNCGDDAAARAQSIRSGLRHGTNAAPTAA